MNEATKKTLSQFRELTDSEKHDARQKFVRMKDATEMAGMQIKQIPTTDIRLRNLKH